MAVALIITAILVVVSYAYYKITSAHSYWKKRGVVGPKPHPIFGNIRTILATGEDNIITLTDRLYNEFPNEKTVGVYQGTKPALILRDPGVIKDVLIRDFGHFVNRGVLSGTDIDPIAKNLFTIDGDEWKTLRQKLTPIFTTGKLKNMMPLLNNCVEQYTAYLDKLIEEDGLRDIRKLKMKYTLKVITSIAFGVEVDTFVEEPTEFERVANKLLNPTILRKITLVIDMMWPGIVNKLRLPDSATGFPGVTKFFLQLVREIVQQREGKPKVRKDFMDLLIEMKEQGTVKRVQGDGVVELEMTHEFITAQAIIFYFAGFETSSGAMSFLLYELAKQPDIQAKCHEEIDRVMQKYDGKLDYDALKELEYLSMAMDEGLRMYPTTGVLLRQCSMDYTFKDINMTVEKGTNIIVPVYGLHRDPTYYPNPEQFDPERFSAANKDSLRDVYMPFGDGPRNCIGLRFARVQSLLGIAHFLHRFRVSPSDKTPKTLTVNPKQNTLGSIGGVWLNVEKRKRVKN